VDDPAWSLKRLSLDRPNLLMGVRGFIPPCLVATTVVGHGGASARRVPGPVQSQPAQEGGRRYADLGRDLLTGVALPRNAVIVAHEARVVWLGNGGTLSDDEAPIHAFCPEADTVRRGMLRQQISKKYPPIGVRFNKLHGRIYKE